MLNQCNPGRFHGWFFRCGCNQTQTFSLKTTSPPGNLRQRVIPSGTTLPQVAFQRQRHSAKREPVGSADLCASLAGILAHVNLSGVLSGVLSVPSQGRSGNASVKESLTVQVVLTAPQPGQSFLTQKVLMLLLGRVVGEKNQHTHSDAGIPWMQVKRTKPAFSRKRAHKAFHAQPQDGTQAVGALPVLPLLLQHRRQT